MINAGDMVNAFQRLPAIIDTIVKHHDDNPAQDYLSTLADPHGTLGKGFKIPSLSGIKTTTGYNYQTCDFTMRGENAIVIYNPNVIRGSPYIVMNH